MDNNQHAKTRVQQDGNQHSSRGNRRHIAEKCAKLRPLGAVNGNYGLGQSDNQYYNQGQQVQMPGALIVFLYSARNK